MQNSPQGRKESHHSTFAFLPDLDAGHDHLTILLPCRQPLIPGRVEVFLRREGLINPGLAGLAILEPAVGATDANVEDQVE